MEIAGKSDKALQCISTENRLFDLDPVCFFTITVEVLLKMYVVLSF